MGMGKGMGMGMGSGNARQGDAMVAFALGWWRLHWDGGRVTRSKSTRHASTVRRATTQRQVKEGGRVGV